MTAINKTLWIVFFIFGLVSCENNNEEPSAEEVGDIPTQPSSVVAEPTMEFILNEGNYSRVLAEVFRVFSGQAYDERLTNRPYEQADNFQCDNGAGYNVSSNVTGPGSVIKIRTYENCTIQGLTLTGEVQSDTVSVGHNQFEFSNFVTEFDADSTMTLNGEFGHRCCFLGYESVVTHDLDYELSTPTITQRIENSTTKFKKNWPSYGELTGQFVLYSPVAGGSKLTVHVDTTLRFEFHENVVDAMPEAESTWGFTEGQLTIAADDGSSIVLNAAATDPSMVRLTIHQNTKTTEIEAFWSEWLPDLTFTADIRFLGKPVTATALDLLRIGFGLDIEQDTNAASLTDILDVIVRSADGSQPLQDQVSDVVYDEFESGPSMTSGVLFNCRNGGRLLRLITINQPTEVPSTSSWEAHHYEFDECGIDTRLVPEFSDGKYTFNGIYRFINTERLLSTGLQTSECREWRGLVIDSPNQSSSRRTGQHCTVQQSDPNSNRESTGGFAYALENSAGIEVIKASSNYSVTWHEDAGGTSRSQYTINSEIQNNLTQQQSASLSTVEPIVWLNDTVSGSHEISGEIRMDLTSGEYLTMTRISPGYWGMEQSVGGELKIATRRFHLPQGP